MFEVNKKSTKKYCSILNFIVTSLILLVFEGLFGVYSAAQKMKISISKSTGNFKFVRIC